MYVIKHWACIRKHCWTALLIISLRSTCKYTPQCDDPMYVHVNEMIKIVFTRKMIGFDTISSWLCTMTKFPQAADRIGVAASKNQWVKKQCSVVIVIMALFFLQIAPLPPILPCVSCLLIYICKSGDGHFKEREGDLQSERPIDKDTCFK